MEQYKRLGGDDDGGNIRVVRIRLKAARAFIDFLLKAYDALLYHGVNYRTLPEFKDETLLEQVETQRIERGYDSLIEWMRRLTNGINAAVRRKGFHVAADNTKERDK